MSLRETENGLNHSQERFDLRITAFILSFVFFCGTAWACSKGVSEDPMPCQGETYLLIYETRVIDGDGIFHNTDGRIHVRWFPSLQACEDFFKNNNRIYPVRVVHAERVIVPVNVGNGHWNSRWIIPELSADESKAVSDGK